MSLTGDDKAALTPQVATRLAAAIEADDSGGAVRKVFSQEALPLAMAAVMYALRDPVRAPRWAVLATLKAARVIQPDAQAINIALFLAKELNIQGGIEEARTLVGFARDVQEASEDETAVRVEEWLREYHARRGNRLVVELGSRAEVENG